MNSERMSSALYIPVAAATAGTASDLFCVNRTGGKAKVVAVDFVADGAVTANDTNYATFTASVGGTSIGAVSTTTTDSGDIADGGVASVALSGAGSNLVADGGAVKVAITKPGTGVAIAGTVQVTLERVRAD